MTFKNRHSLLSLAALLFLVAGCSDSNNSDDNSSGDLSNAPASAIADPSGLKTACGVVAEGALRNPVSLDRGKVARISAVSDSNLLTIDLGGESKVIKLQALGTTSGFDNTAARKYLEGLGNTTLYYFPAEEGCTATVGTTTAEVGQLVTDGGTSVSESMLNAKIAGVVETAGDCGEAFVGACYVNLTASTGSTAGDPATDITQSAGEVGDFLWKPNSESSYNPGGVSILLNPCGGEVRVNGSPVRNYGGTNGRCITARSGSSGCSYGSNIKVEYIETSTGRPFSFGGQPSITIPNGCNRLEFEGVDGGSGGTGTGSDGHGSGSPASSAVSCSTAPAEFTYDPAAPECNGNAALFLRGGLAGAFSVQLRLPDGGDRLDESCGERSCSPYKVQNETSRAADGSRGFCFGTPGSANLMTDVEYATIKETSDDSTPLAYCITDPAAGVN